MQILDEDVPDAAASHAGIPLAPHDPAGPSLDLAEVHGFDGAFGVDRVVVVDVGVAEGTAGDGVAADADGGDGADGVEYFVEGGFVDGGVEVADVEGGVEEVGGVVGVGRVGVGGGRCRGVGGGDGGLGGGGGWFGGFGGHDGS